jgi:hypothetical protein
MVDVKVWHPSHYDNLRGGSHKYKQHDGKEFLPACCLSPAKDNTDREK